MWDILARPLPEVPFPNDAATRLVASSPTGRRINVSEDAATEVERRFRRNVNELDGFALLAPISVSFDAPIDWRDVHERHTGDEDLGNDALLLFRLGGEGEACDASRPVRLDMGHGHYPLVLERPCQYHYAPWEGDYNCIPQSCEGDDPRWMSSNLLLETVDEDLDGDGELDPYEDTDFDGVLDKPNTWSGEATDSADAGDLVSFYEMQTNSLVAWPILPLDEGAKYAAVVTRSVKDEEGRSVESPFEGRAPATQVPALQALEDILPCHGLDLDDVAFAWTFTTGRPTRELLAIRAGLYGHGTLDWVADVAPTSTLIPERALDPLPDGTVPDNAWIMPQEVLGEFMEPLASAVLQQGGGGTLAEDTAHVDYWVLGQYQSPHFLTDKDGRATELYPDDQDEHFDVDVDAGTATVTAERVPFLCSIPKTTEDYSPPFPVVLYAHGYSGASFEIIGFAGRHARAGQAVCAIEAPGHGLAIPEEEAYIFDLFLPLLDEAGFTSFIETYLGGRARDNDGDGLVGERDNGTDFWVADVFHTRDMVRQLAIDQMQLIRILRDVDGKRTMQRDIDGDGEDDLLTDFNADGIPDLGGWRDLDRDGKRGSDEPDNPIYAWGQSLGGISSAILAAVDPAVRAAAPISGGGGLVHVALRSKNLGVPEAVLMPILGPWITFRPHVWTEAERDAAEEAEAELPEDGGGLVDIGFLAPRVNEPVRPVFATTDQIGPGDRIIVENLTTGEHWTGFADDDLTFRIAFAADALRLGERREALGITEDSELPRSLESEGSLAIGDALRLTVLEGWEGEPKQVIEEVGVPFTFGGVRYEEGARLVSIAEGLGKSRNHPDLRRFVAVSQTVMEPADPAIYAKHIFLEPLDFPYETGSVKEARDAGRTTRLLQWHTIGDSDAPVAAGLNLARAAGLITPEDMQLLIDHHVVEGVERVGHWPQLKEHQKLCPPPPKSEWTCPPARVGEEDRYRVFYETEGCTADQGECSMTCAEDEVCHYDGFCAPCRPECAAMADAEVEYVHFDLMDLDEGRDLLILPEYNLDPPWRPIVEASAGPRLDAQGASAKGVHALRLPYMDRYGSHGVPPSIPDRQFDINSYVINTLVWYFQTDGEELVDAPCMVDGSCESLPW